MYTSRYGSNTAVFYQNGDFFEIYGVDNETEKLGMAKEIAELLCITLTRRKTAILENNRKNPLMAGFPVAQLEKYATKLTENHNFVVIIVEQIQREPKIVRGVTNIISPGSNIRYLSGSDANYLVSVYIECAHSQKTTPALRPIVNVGISAIDVSTGHTHVYQTWNTIDDPNRAIDETARFIQVYQPREVIINTNNYRLPEGDPLNLNGRLTHIYNYRDGTSDDDNKNRFDEKYHQVKFQNQYLARVYKSCGVFQPIEYIGLERCPLIITSFIILLDYCYNQNEHILEKIQIPEIWNNHSRLILDNNSTGQLNIFNAFGNSGGKMSSVFSLLNQTSTPMGKRYLYERLSLPFVDHHQMTRSYDQIDYFRQHYEKYEHHLNQINDIERCHRKMCLQMLHPQELNVLMSSYQHIVEIAKLYNAEISSSSHSTIKIEQLLEYLDYLNHNIDFTQLSRFNLINIDESVFNYGINPELDQYEDTIGECEDFCKEFAESISFTLSNGKDGSLCSYLFSNDTGYHLDITNARYAQYLQKAPDNICISGHTINIIKDIQCTKYNNGKSCRLTGKILSTYSDRVRSAKNSLKCLVIKLYKAFIVSTYTKYELLFRQLADYIAVIDFYKSCAKSSLLWNYSRPQFQNSTPDSMSNMESECGTLIAKNIRHPLIERFQSVNTYVPQDVDFNQNRGILLFGVNASGKSSLMKAIGISVILAQAGMYVPASEFIFNPYKSIMTRIIGNDNLFKGLSSFAVEMGELRGILQRANSQTLVLGDEICHGTETVSAISIVAASIITLSRKNACYLFATHLHHLSDMDCIKEIPTLGMYHLSVYYNQSGANLIYDRKLKKGSGSSIYGLEVAKSMNFSSEFILMANEIRKDIIDFQPLLGGRKSHYNSDLYVEWCGIPGCNRRAIDTHHIKFQETADAEGFIEGTQLHKNHLSNLVPLCKPCHQQVHCTKSGSYRLQINGYITTESGVVLDFERIKNE